MSQQPHGPDWRRAGDGRYYPPNAHTGQPGATPSEVAWTEVIPSSGLGSSRAARREPLRDRWWFWVMLLVVALAFVFGVPILA